MFKRTLNVFSTSYLLLFRAAQYIIFILKKTHFMIFSFEMLLKLFYSS